MASRINRRKFFRETVISAAGFLLAKDLTSCATPDNHQASAGLLMEEVMKYRKLDAHSHVYLSPDSEPEEVLDFADRLGITRMCISRPITNFSGREPEGPEQVRESNDLVLKAVRAHPDRFIGFLTLNPVYQKESLEELNRCVGEGMAGYKGYTQVKISDPLYYPIIEKFIDLKMVMLMHGFCQLGLGGYRMKYNFGGAPNTSIPEDFVIAAKRFPEAMLQYAHIGGGADWEYACKLFRNYPNIYVDTSGSNNEENMLDFAVGILGEDRVLYGSDGSFYQAVGKFFSSNLTEAQKKKVFFDNYNGLLRKGGHDAA